MAGCWSTWTPHAVSEAIDAVMPQRWPGRECSSRSDGDVYRRADADRDVAAVLVSGCIRGGRRRRRRGRRCRRGARGILRGFPAMMAVMMRLLGALQILLQGGEGLLRAGGIAGLQRLSQGGEIRLHLAVAALCVAALPGLCLLETLLQRAEGALGAGKVARAQALLQLAEVVVLLLKLTLLRGLKSTRAGRNRVDRHSG